MSAVRHQLKIFLGLLCAALCCLRWDIGAAQGSARTFDWVWHNVSEKFYDPDFNGVAWDAMKGKYRGRALRAHSREQQAQVINDMLAELRTSHTHFYTPDTPEYFQILGVFLRGNDTLAKEVAPSLTGGRALYCGVGMYTSVFDGEHFVSAVFEGMPAHRAGVLVGDRIVSIDGAPYHPIRSFAGKADRSASMVVERSAGDRRTISMTPIMLDGATMFVDAMSASVQIVPSGGRRIGYLHAWSYAGPQYQEILEDELLFGRLKDADALVLDIRDGWGGADPSYLNLFTQRGLSWITRQRDGATASFPSGWSKPVVLLINSGSRSGKELLAYAFKRGKVGTIVGTRTGGAVLAGAVLADEQANLLYLATLDVTLDDGARLEGRGVEPDIEVPFEVAFAQGRDPQKERAVIEAARLAGAG